MGSCAAFALQCGGIVSEIQLIDANQAMAEGEALDLLHGSAFTADQRITAGSYEQASDSDIFLITAGLRRKPDESRLDLINRNVALFVQILESIQKAGMRQDAIVFVVSNPVDILTHLAGERLGLPWQQVIGLGTMLDSTRFSSLIAEALDLAPTQVKALTLGEHGDSMVPIWSASSVNGLPLTEYPGCGPGFQGQIFTRTRGSGAEVIKRKGGGRMGRWHRHQGRDSYDCSGSEPPAARFFTGAGYLSDQGYLFERAHGGGAWWCASTGRTQVVAQRTNRTAAIGSRPQGNDVKGSAVK